MIIFGSNGETGHPRIRNQELGTVERSVREQVSSTPLLGLVSKTSLSTFLFIVSCCIMFNGVTRPSTCHSYLVEFSLLIEGYLGQLRVRSRFYECIFKMYSQVSMRHPKILSRRKMCRFSEVYFFT